MANGCHAGGKHPELILSYLRRPLRKFSVEAEHGVKSCSSVVHAAPRLHEVILLLVTASPPSFQR